MTTICSTCIYGRNCINGRYCLMTRTYVDFKKLQGCDNHIKRNGLQQV